MRNAGNKRRELAVKVVRAAIIIVLTVGVAGFAWLLCWLELSLGTAAPLYVSRAFFVVGLAGVVALALVLCGLLPRRGRQAVGVVFLIVCLGGAVYVGHGVWRDSIPTVDDRDLILREYEPNVPDTKAVHLEEEASLQLSGYLLPSIDGATALYPVYAAFVQAVYPEGAYPIRNDHGEIGLVACTNTVGAYRRLIDRDVDVIFVAAPSQAQREEAEAAGIELHLTPIGREAFVFFVNSKNPVEGLTVEQVRSIYSGEITRWSQVGGPNWKIRPFQRAENSGSQSALQRLMGDVPLMEPEKEDRIGGMGEIIQQTASYRNYKNALGYSFRYYSTQMAVNDQIRLLSLDGVFPTRETIRDGSYPISSEFYAVTASPTGQPAPEERDQKLADFLEWIRSEQGQRIVEETGYVALGPGLAS